MKDNLALTDGRHGDEGDFTRERGKEAFSATQPRNEWSSSRMNLF